MKANPSLKTLLAMMLSIVVQSVSYGIIEAVWPTETTTSAEKVAYPSATLLATMVFLVRVIVIWRKKSDGTYTNTAVVRWTNIGLLVFWLVATAFVTIVVICSV